jgi:hypothetical protein
MSFGKNPCGSNSIESVVVLLGEGIGLSKKQLLELGVRLLLLGLI